MVNAISADYQSYTGLPPVTRHNSVEAAVAQAAHDTLVALFPVQTPSFHELLAADLGQMPDGPQKNNGIDLGHRVAAAVLALRNNDGSHHLELRVGVDFITGAGSGKWRQDPISTIPLALRAYWKGVTPFVLTSVTQFRAPPPPALESAEYAAAFDEVKRLGGDGISTA